MAGNEEKLQQQLQEAMEKLKEGGRREEEARLRAEEREKEAKEREKNLQAELKKAREKLDSNGSELRRRSPDNTGFMAEGSFKLEVEVERIGDKAIFSPYTSVGGLPFRIGCKTKPYNGEKNLYASLYCNDSATPTSFSAIVEYSLSLDSTKNIAFNYRSISATKEFKPSFPCYGMYVKWPEFNDSSNGYINYGRCTVEVKIKVLCYDKEVSIDFASPDPNLSDVTLVVGGKRFNVCKNYLALHSEYFKALFCSDFAEKGKTEIELKNINANNFEEMLRLIYPQRKKVTAATVTGLLSMADFFDVPIVRMECIKFLNDSTDLSLVAKLKITEEFRAYGLRYKLLESVKKADDLKPVIKSTDFANLSLTLQNIVQQKFFDLS